MKSEFRRKSPRRDVPIAEALRFGTTAVIVFFTVLFRRIFVGKGHPRWSFRKEVVTLLMRATFARMIRMPPATMRARELATPVGFRQRRLLVHQVEYFAGLAAEVFTPKNFSPDGLTILWFHGGGYVACSPRTHRDLLSRIAAAAGARCIALEYRKAPEFPFPAGIDDCELAYRALLDAGVLPQRLILAGDSAGGGLALAVLQRARAQGLPLPRASVLLSPWVDLTRSGASMVGHVPYDFLSPSSLEFAVAQYLQGGDPRHPEASPLFADLKGLPPMFVQTGGAELFFSENEAFVARARAHGVQVTHTVHEGMAHVFANFASFVPECSAGVGEIADFIKAQERALQTTRAA